MCAWVQLGKCDQCQIITFFKNPKNQHCDYLRGKNVKTEEENAGWSKIKSNELKNKKLGMAWLMSSQTILN